jgi:aspartate 1-decarboxylase
MMKGKLHRAAVTQAELHYVGSVTIDEGLLEQSGILSGERVQIVDIDNGERLETYTIAGRRGSGVICINGAAARRVQVGDRVIIIAYALMDEAEARTFRPRVLVLDERNAVVEVHDREVHGTII